ncbi:hypothetical protein [Mycobacterium sp. PS03-16]|uniref:DUF7159 family protein n=1 Tax=Mycobacterium sp. PS03-16 TaxID=2559611 RepID=UPI003529BA95
MTSEAIRFALVEGATGDGATLDSGTLDIAVSGADAEALLDAALGDGPYAAAPGQRPRSVGVVWTDAVAAEAAAVVASLTARGVDNVIALTPSEAAAALVTGLSDLTGRTELAMCVREPEVTLAAVVTADTVLVDQVGRQDPAGVAQAVLDTVASTGAAPEALYVLGSGSDVDAIVAELGGQAQPVLSATEADLALARGAALASAQDFVGVAAPLALAPAADDQPRKPWSTRRVPALTSLLVAAVVTFVVSLSVALGLQLTPGTRSGDAATQQAASASDQPVRAMEPAPEVLPDVPAPAAPPPAPEASPPPPPEAAPVVEDVPAAPAPEPEVAPVSEPVFEPPAAPPPAPEPVYVPPVPAYVPPAPAYVPPGPAPAYVAPDPMAPGYVAPQSPGYVPPVNAPQPRLRDRIIERIPIINRFHEPQYTAP